MRTSRTRARDRSKVLVRNGYIRYVCLRRKRTDNGKVPGGRGAQLGQEDLHELQCSKRHKGDALQEVWLQRPQDKDPRNEESLDHLRPHDCSITSTDRANALENRGKKKKGWRRLHRSWASPFGHTSPFPSKECVCQNGSLQSILLTITFVMVRCQIAAILLHEQRQSGHFSNKDIFN